MRGAPYQPSEPRAARGMGVAMVFQHFSLFDALSVAENVALGMDNPPALRDLARRIREVSEGYGLPLDPTRLVGDLSAGERQRIEGLRCLLQEPKRLIMDEPASVLTPQEVTILFGTLRQLAAEGTSILYISHKLEEIRSLCGDATILRHGKVVGSCDPRATSARAMAAADQSYADYIAPLKDEHRELGAFLAGIDLTDPEHVARFRRELVDLAEHIAREEDGLFPATLVTLGGADWDASIAAWEAAHPGRTLNTD